MTPRSRNGADAVIVGAGAALPSRRGQCARFQRLIDGRPLVQSMVIG
jgi:hypothetical protein